jgi:aspartyl-tRNA(Asn)/glutamyl-tRNA(Gln) amidotransferase subunit A
MQREVVIDGKTLPYGLQGIWAGVTNVTGQPATAMPIGLSPEGLPIGMQMIGRYGSDDRLLDLGAAYEAAHPWADRWPSL